MATAEDIPADLALEIGEDFEPKRFLATARAFFSYVDSISGAPSGSDRLEWRVKVKQGSNIIALAPAFNVPATVVQSAYEHVEAVTTALVSGNFSDINFDDATLEHASRLADCAKGKDGIAHMQVWVRRTAILFSADVGDFIREETRPAYRDYGSIEGTLKTIQDGKGGLELRIRDPLWPRPIKCFVPETMLEEVMVSFRERVELFGEIQYRKDDTPDSVRVERLERLPGDNELPSASDVRGLLADGAA